MRINVYAFLIIQFVCVTSIKIMMFWKFEYHIKSTIYSQNISLQNTFICVIIVIIQSIWFLCKDGKDESPIWKSCIISKNATSNAKYRIRITELYILHAYLLLFRKPLSIYIYCPTNCTVDMQLTVQWLSSKCMKINLIWRTIICLFGPNCYDLVTISIL